MNVGLQEKIKEFWQTLRFETQKGQGREIVGGKPSSFTPPQFEYSSINPTISDCKQPNDEDQKAVEQVIDK